MKTLLIFTLCLISGPVSCVDVIGYSGGSALINCNFKQHDWSPEYFCKKSAQQCVYLDQTQNTWSNKDSVYLHSNPGSTSVIYRNLSVQDAGSYQCGTTGAWNQDLNLRVIENPCCLGSKTVSGHLGKTLTISCSYPDQYEEHIKTFLKQAGRYFTELIDTEDSQKGRFSISDNPGSKVVSVRISDVREEDGGVYYCGVTVGGESVSYDSLFTEIQLQVTDEDECENNPCGGHSVCHNTLGSYFCTCQSGFQSRIPNFTPSTGQCKDINECLTSNPCSENMMCTNTIGSYTCECLPGYQKSTGSATCTEVGGAKPTPNQQSSLNIMVPEDCKLYLTPECAKKVLSQINNITDQVSSLKEVEDTLKLLTEQHHSLFGEPVSSFNSIVKATDQLLSTLVKRVETSSSVSMSLKTLEARVFEVGPKNSLKKITELHTPDAIIDIDLVGISANHKNQGHAAVAFISYTNMSNSSFFTKTTNSPVLLMSTVVSATLPKTKNTTLTKPVQFTLKHKQNLIPNRTLSCVYWAGSDWDTDGCTLIDTNGSYSICSCTHLSTFSLIMQIEQSQDPAYLKFIAMVALPLGLLFLALALLTFALCWKNPRVINTARINLCISLLLAHLLFLLTQSLLNLIQPLKLACAALAGVLHFLFLSAFVWMFIEAMMLFIAVINLSRPKSKQKAGLNWKLLTVAGYMVALVVVGVSAGVVPDGYGSEKCWLKEDKGFVWSFLGPVSFILASNTILFILIAVSLGASLARLNSQVSQIRQTRTLFFKTTAQFIIFGCPWMLGLFSSNSKVLQIIFLILSSQQGTFIFIVHCVLSKEVRQKYKKLLGDYCMTSYLVSSVTEVQNIQG